MSFKYIVSPHNTSLGGSNENPNFNSNKRHFSNDDDNTFLPPALSSYSIALLNDRTRSSPVNIKRFLDMNGNNATNINNTSNINNNSSINDSTNNTTENTGPNVTGIYELDFPDQKRASNLKNKLSVHFKEQASGMDPNSNINSITYQEVESNQSINISSNSIQDQNYPSTHNSFNMSTNNYSSHTHNTTSEEDQLEQSPQSVKTTTSGESNPPSRNLHSIKRMRGSRRFGKVLGPPQRASRMSDHYENIDIHSENDPSKQEHQEPLSSPHLSTSNHIISTPPAFSSQFSPKLINTHSAFNPNSLLMKSLEKVRGDVVVRGDIEARTDERPHSYSMRVDSQKRPDIYSTDTRGDQLNEQFSRVKVLSQGQQFHEKHNNQKHLEKENFNTPNISPIKTTLERIPLKSVPISNFNHDFDFRKPRIPKTPIPEGRAKALTSAPLAPLAPAPAVAPSAPPSTLTPSHSAPSEEHRKKTIIINGNQYEKLELLGRGGTSKVYKVKALSNNRLYAIKKVTFDQFDESCVKGFKGEIDLLIRLRNADRVVKLIDHAIGEGSIYLVMECGDIDLAHVLQNKLNMKNPLDLNFVKYHAIEIFKCVRAVHAAGIVHSDLKPANFLFVRGILHIIDFGIANAVPDHTANIYRESQIGTPNYMAPEALVEVNQTFPGLPISEHKQQEQRNTWKVGKPSDVWSCGCIIYQMIYGKPPYGGYSGNQRIMAIMNPQVKISFPPKSGDVVVPQSAINLMQNCLSRNPNERWTIDECLNSDFLNPKVVSECFIRDLVHLAVNYGYNKRVNGGGPMTTDVYDALVDSVLNQIENLNY